MLGRIDRWTRWLMRYAPADRRVAAVKANAYIELVIAGWTGGTDDLGETLALSVCRDAVRLRIKGTCELEAAEAGPIPLSGSPAPTGAPPSFALTAMAMPASADGLAPTVTAARNLATLAELLEEMDAWARMSSDCSNKTVWPPVPEALFRCAEDGLWAADKVVQHQCGRRWYPPGIMDALRAMSFEGAFVDPSGRNRRRRDEIVAAFERWTLAREAAALVSGLDFAKSELTACSQRIAAIRDAILDRPAANFGDVLAKAVVVSW